jgi:hypothetical protein
MTSSAAIWSGALQASAILLTGGVDGARWGIDQPGGEYLAAPLGQRAGTARRVVELAVQLIMELPDDPEAGIPEAKEAAQRWLDTRGR